MKCDVCEEERQTKNCSNEPFSSRKINVCRACGLKHGYEEWIWEKKK